jgi:hypothetical protein
MSNRTTRRVDATTASVFRDRAIVAAAAALLVTGCGGDAVDIAREIDAAREGCTEERLREGAEECVQMFERYAEMGTDALETYIGAMQALDEALQRRGYGLEGLDTTGLGRAITPGVLPTGRDPQTGPADPTFGRSGSERSPSWGAAQPGYGAGGGESDILPPAPGTESEAPRRSLDPSGWPSGWGEPERGSSASVYPAPGQGEAARPSGGSEARQPAPQRGVLLPPDERLRRPWLEGQGVPDREPVEREPWR